MLITLFCTYQKLGVLCGCEKLFPTLCRLASALALLFIPFELYGTRVYEGTLCCYAVMCNGAYGVYVALHKSIRRAVCIPYDTCPYARFVYTRDYA